MMVGKGGLCSEGREMFGEGLGEEVAFVSGLEA